MLKRCYSSDFHNRRPTYKDCEVCEEWKYFMNFKKWMEKQDWEGKQLDKDFLFKGNRVYSPETCVFIPNIINSFTMDCGANRGKYMIGVYWSEDKGKFRSCCRNPFTGKTEFLGYFNNELEAHLTWKKRKHELACQLADSEHVTDERVADALRKWYI